MLSSSGSSGEWIGSSGTVNLQHQTFTDDGAVGRGPRKPHDRVLVSAVNSVQRQFLPNGLPLMDAPGFSHRLPQKKSTGKVKEVCGKVNRYLSIQSISRRDRQADTKDLTSSSTSRH